EGMAKLTLGTGAFLWCHAGGAPLARVPAGVVSSCAWALGDDTAYGLEGFVPNAGGVTTWLRQLGVLADGTWPVIRDGAVAAAAGGGLERRAAREGGGPGAGGVAGVGAGRGDRAALGGRPLETGAGVRPGLPEDAGGGVRQAWQAVLYRSLA